MVFDFEKSDDRRLVELANGGDRDAFESLYRNHRDWVVSLAWRFLGDREDALDVMQEVFAYLFRQFPGFELRSTMRAYLYPVVKHQCISLIRKKLKVVPLNRDETAAETVAWRPEPPGDFARIVSALPEDQREVIKLRFGLEMRLEEIAAALEIPLGTVKSRLHNALKSLKKTQIEKK